MPHVSRPASPDDSREQAVAAVRAKIRSAATADDMKVHLARAMGLSTADEVLPDVVVHAKGLPHRYEKWCLVHFARGTFWVAANTKIDNIFDEAHAEPRPEEPDALLWSMAVVRANLAVEDFLRAEKAYEQTESPPPKRKPGTKPSPGTAQSAPSAKPPRETRPRAASLDRIPDLFSQESVLLPATQADEVDAADLKRALTKTLEAALKGKLLAKNQKRDFILRYLRGLSYEQIHELVGYRRKGSVKKSLKQARTKLQAYLLEHLPKGIVDGVLAERWPALLARHYAERAKTGLAPEQQAALELLDKEGTPPPSERDLAAAFSAAGGIPGARWTAGEAVGLANEALRNRARRLRVLLPPTLLDYVTRNEPGLLRTRLAA